MPELGSILAIGSMRIGTPGEQTFASGVYSKVAFDDLTRTSPGVSASIVTDEITIAENGFYELDYRLNVVFPGTEVMQLMPYVNDAAYSTEPVSGVGEGTGDPIAVMWTSGVYLFAGNVVDLRAANSAPGDLVADIRRGTFSIAWRGNTVP